MSRKPAITSLLKGQAVKVLFGSTSVTCSFASEPFQRAGAGRAAKAAADHGDARPDCADATKGKASDAAATAMP